MSIHSESKVQTELGHSEALVLFDFLADFSDQASLEIPSSAERLALMRLAGSLEGTLVDVFDPDYRERVDTARAESQVEGGG